MAVIVKVLSLIYEPLKDSIKFRKVVHGCFSEKCDAYFALVSLKYFNIITNAIQSCIFFYYLEAVIMYAPEENDKT